MRVFAPNSCMAALRLRMRPGVMIHTGTAGQTGPNTSWWWSNWPEVAGQQQPGMRMVRLPMFAAGMLPRFPSD